MAVMKGETASSMLKEAIVLDLGDIGRQAARIREAAQHRAAQIEDEAKQRAQQLIDTASSKGFEQGRAAGFAQGMAEGRKQGHAEAFEHTAQQLQQLQESWQQAASQWEQYRESLQRDARQAVLELALRLAEKIVHRVVQVDESVIIEQVAQALAHVLGAYDVLVRINPQDRPVLEQAVPDLLAEFTDLKHLELRDDESIARGGCTVGFGQGLIDSTLETQLCRIVEIMLPEPVAPTEPLHADEEQKTE